MHKKIETENKDKRIYNGTRKFQKYNNNRNNEYYTPYKL